VHWLGRVLIVLALAVAVLAPAVWLGRDTMLPRLAQWAINRSLGTEAIDALAFRVQRVGLDGLSLTDIRVNRDDQASIDRLDVVYEWRALLAGRVADVVLVGPTVSIRVDDDGSVSFGSLDRVRAAILDRDDAGAPADFWPVPSVRLIGTRINIAGAVAGAVRLTGPATLAPGGLGATLDIDADLRRGFGDRLVASGRAVLGAGPEGRRFVVTLETGEITFGQLSLSGLKGTASLGQSSEGAVTAVIDLRAREAWAAGAAMPLPAVFARLDRFGASAVMRLGPVDAPDTRLAITIDRRDEDGRHRIQIEGTADLARLDTVLAAVMGRAAVGVTGSAALRAAGAIPEAPDDPGLGWADVLWRETTASGGIDLRFDAIPTPDPVRGVATGSGRLVVAMAAGRLVVETVGPFQIDTEFARTSQAFERVLGDGPLTMTLGSKARPLSLLLTTVDAVPRLAIAGPVTARAVSGATVSVDGQALAAPMSRGWRLVNDTELAITASHVTLEPLRVERAQLTITDLTVTEDTTSAVWALAVDGSAPSAGAEGIALSLAGHAEHDAARTTLVAREPGRLIMRGVAVGDALAPMETVTVALGGGSRPLLVVPADEAPVTLRMPMSLSALRLADRAETWAVAIDPTHATFEASVDRAGRGSARLRLRDGRAEAIGTGVTLEGLAADLRLAVAAGVPSLDRLELVAARLSDRRRLPWFVPLSLEASARPAAGGRVGFLATARGANGALVIDVAGQVMPSRDAVLATFKVFPIEFIPGGLQPADLVPAAAALFRDASGRVAVDGTVGWPTASAPVDDPLTVSIADLSFTGSLGSVSGLKGEVSLTGVDPIETASDQVLMATAIDLGVPIAQPVVRFQVTDGDTLRLNRIEARFADGMVLAEDVVIPLAADEEVTMTFDVTDVDAARLAEVVDLAGLEASGTLSGRLPVVWSPRDGVSVRAARLAANGGGTVRYAPATLPTALRDVGPEVSLMLQVIRNLVYERLELEADGKPGEPFDIKLRVRGANPDLYDGHPVALNVTLTGRLDELFLNARRSLGLGDVLLRRIQTDALGG